jgi:hypothetical protein
MIDSPGLSSTEEHQTSTPVPPERGTRPDAPEATSPWRRRLLEVLFAVATGAISVVFAVIALRLKPQELTERWVAGAGDAILHYTLFTNATQSFSFADNLALGFPRGLNVFFSGQVDVSSAFVMWFMSLFIHNGILFLNIFWLLTFVGAGITGYAFFRALRVRPWLSILFGAVFSLAPYHFIRVGYGHAFIANYWAIPVVGILLLVAAGEATDPFKAWGDRATTRRSMLLRRLLPPALLGLLVATTGGYYFVFGVIVVGGVWALSIVRVLVRREGIRALLVPSAAMLPLGFAVVLELFLLGRGYGERFAPYFSARLPAESELYAGKLISLLAPWSGSDFPILNHFTTKYNATSWLLKSTEEPGSPLVASIGLGLLVLATLTLLATRGSTTAEGRTTWFGRFAEDPRIRMLASAAIWTFPFFVVSGFGVLLALVLGPEIRAWSRISIVLILLGLGAAAVALERATTRYGIRWILAGLVVIVALLDQVAGVHNVITLRATADPVVKSFVEKTEKKLPHGCGVVQLPLKAFLDASSVGALRDYDEAVPYLYTKPGDLRWSYGSIKGTKGWNYWGDITTPAQFAKAVSKSGACAIEVDANGYTKNVNGWKPFVEAATKTDVPAIVSSDKRYMLFPVPGK